MSTLDLLLAALDLTLTGARRCVSAACELVCLGCCAARIRKEKAKHV